jgi:glycosyltransferase involved in cell wall biosynthesis
MKDMVPQLAGSRPLVSVVIPTYNRAHQLANAIQSVLAQTLHALEVIVVDDGSSDETAEQMRCFVTQQDDKLPQIRYFRQANQGSSAARNKGIAEARGTWIAFLDSDDIWYPEKLEWQIRAIESSSGACEACITDALLVSESGTETTSFHASGKAYVETFGPVDHAVERLAKSFDHFWITCLLVRTELATNIGGFDADIQFCEDHDFNFRLSRLTSFCYVNKVLVQMDRSPAPADIRPWERAEVRLRNGQLMREKWLKDLTLPAPIRKIVERELRHVYSGWANWYLETERYEEAREALSQAIKLGFTSPLVIKWVLARVAPSFARRLTPRVKAYTA